jgi:hypothetical protein
LSGSGAFMEWKGFARPDIPDEYELLDFPLWAHGSAKAASVTAKV